MKTTGKLLLLFMAFLFTSSTGGKGISNTKQHNSEITSDLPTTAVMLEEINKMNDLEKRIDNLYNESQQTKTQSLSVE